MKVQLTKPLHRSSGKVLPVGTVLEAEEDVPMFSWKVRLDKATKYLPAVYAFVPRSDCEPVGVTTLARNFDGTLKQATRIPEE